MKGFVMMTSVASLLPALIILLTVNNGLVEAIYTMNQTCAYYPQGYIGNPNDCKAWGYCSGGKLQHTGFCNGNYLYDMSLGMCVQPNLVQCGTNEVNICANSADPTFVAVPNNCNQYAYCANQKIMEYNSCPSGQLYNPSSQSCVQASSYSCPLDSVCRLVPNNAFVGSPTNCGKYIRCLDGSGTENPCNNGYFNALTGYCQKTNPCVASSPSNPNTYPPKPSICTGSTGTLTKPQFLSDEQTCYGYYTCSSDSGTGLWRKCLFGTFFNVATQNCDSPVSVVCVHNRCGNIDLPFVTAPFSQCKEYYVCNNNQQSVTSYKCPETYPFFDEIRQGCVSTNPGYAICAAAGV